jgi:GNAT superfamily N-acetyltransferase
MCALEIREASVPDAEAIARVHVDTWRTTYRGLLPAALLDTLDYGHREAFWTGTISGRAGAGSVFVAETEAGVVGFASCGPERSGHKEFHGELYAVYVLEAHQGLGIGRSLFDAVVRRLIRDGFDSMLVWVLEGNPARTFYERMGGRHAGTRTERVGDSDLVEAAYCWSGLA